jgi:hypothetical protein
MATVKEPYSFVTDNEKLTKFCDVKIDKNIYQFFIDLFKDTKIIYTIDYNGSKRMLLGNRLLPVSFYYMYPVAYGIRGDGVREITVAFLDWREKIYAECMYLFYTYPKKMSRRVYSYNQRIEFIVRHIAAKNCQTSAATHSRRHILATGDQLVLWILEKLLYESGEKIESVCLRETGVLLSRRLVDFLKYLCAIRVGVKDYMQKNCQCNGYADGTCICVELCISVRKLYDNVNQLSGNAVLCAPTK